MGMNPTDRADFIQRQQLRIEMAINKGQCVRVVTRQGLARKNNNDTGNGESDSSVVFHGGCGRFDAGDN